MFKYIFSLLLCFSTILVSSQNALSGEDLKETREKIDEYLDQAQVLFNNYRLNEAKMLINAAMQLATDAADNRSLGLVHSKNGKLHLILGDLNQAETSLLKAINLQKIAKDPYNIAESYKTLAQVLLEKKEYLKALNAIKHEEVEHFVEFDIMSFYAETLLIEGEIYLHLGKLTNAHESLDKALELSKKHQLFKMKTKALALIGESYLIGREYELALKELNLALETASVNKFDRLILEIHFLKYEVYKAVSNTASALEELEAYTNLKKELEEKRLNSLTPLNRVSLLNSDYTEFQTTTESDIKTISKDINLSQLTTILSYSLIILLSLLALALHKNNRLRSKSNNVLLKKNARLTIAKENAELVSKAKANFLSTVTHELRTPLYAVTGLTTLLLDEDPKEEQIQHLKSLKYSGEYLLNFINDILQINKIEANKVHLEPVVFDLKQKIANTLLSLENSATQNNTILKYVYDPELPKYFFADEIKITQIIINLVGNAIKFTENGTVNISVIKVSESSKTITIKIQVKDNGIGINEEIQKSLFESFSQGSIQINRKYGGTGLGLSIVKGLLQVLKGKIHMKSTPGKGTTFAITIPVEKTDQKSNPKFDESFKIKKQLTNKYSDIKILVVEDNKINQMITHKILNKMSLKCELVDNGEDAVEKAKNNTYNIILMDIHMPGISGIEATKQIRAFDKKTTIFALTAVTIEDKMEEFDKAGFNDIISKPFKQEIFEQKLYSALKEKNEKQTP